MQIAEVLRVVALYQLIRAQVLVLQFRLLSEKVMSLMAGTLRQAAEAPVEEAAAEAETTEAAE